MKKILVPTDFSAEAANSVDYAAEIAKRMNAALVLLHVYQIPITPIEGGVIMMPVEEPGKQSDAGLKIEADRIAKNHGNAVQVSYKSVCGFAVDEIEAYVKADLPDLVVMGMRGSGFLKEKLMGSITTGFIRRVACPVMVIGQNVKFRMIKRIVFACDQFKYEDKLTLRPLNEIIRKFGSRLFILNVVDYQETVPATPHKPIDYDILDESLADFDWSFHNWPDDNPVDGINEFATEKQADLIALLPRHHTFLNRIVRDSVTKTMAFHSKLPLLILTNDSLNRVNMIM